MSDITNLEGVAIWSDEVENLLKEWSEKASCYRWLHNKCEKKYRLRYFSFSIPVIILSTLTGAANVGLSSYVPEHLQSTGQAIIGGINILAGIADNTNSFSLGTMIVYQGVKFEYAIAVHEVLGISHAIALGIIL